MRPTSDPLRRSPVALLVGLAALATLACEPTPDPPPQAAAPDSVELVDASGARVALPRASHRIVSLVPSVTRVLVALGAEDRLIGRTDFDDLAAVRDLPSVGGGLEPSLEILASLDTEVEIRFAGESDPSTPARLDELGIPHLGVRPDGIDDVLEIVRQMGILVDREAVADDLVAELERELGRVRAATAGREPVAAAFLLGGTPPWVAGPGTFIDELITLAGGRNALADLDRLYGPVSPEVIRERAPAVILTGPGTTVDPAFIGEARRVELPASVELPGIDLAEAAWAVAEALHPDLVR